MLKKSIMSALGLALIFTGWIYIPNISAQAEVVDLEVEPVRVYFLGYDENDIIFRIINNESDSIIIKGLSFRRQILYRPIERDISVLVVDEEHPYLDVLFRTTGDFVWSENHMEQFQLAYQLLEFPNRMYTKIFPELEQTEKEKELINESEQ